ncbi:MAG: glyceraldehyde 3-phosphate dehydrogenase, partial [Congregibacter sp.]
MRVAINGFGRIGRSVFRILEERDDIEVVAVNDLFDHDVLRYLLKYDTVMGPFSHDLSLDDDHLVTPKGRVRMLSERAPSALPWAELGVDAVVESTGVFRSREQLQMHIDAGSPRVVLTVPAKDEI